MSDTMSEVICTLCGKPNTGVGIENGGCPCSFEDMEAALFRAQRSLADSTREQQWQRERSDVFLNQLNRWKDFAQSLTGVDANDHGWLRAELESQWRKHTGYAENLTGAAALVIDMGGHLDCSCSVRERDSGHRSDCYVPEMRVALDGLSAVLAQGYPGSGDPKAANNALPGVGNVPATFTLDRNGEFSDQAIERAELDAGFDRIMALSDEQVLAEARAEGIDVEANAARWRGFLEGFKKARARGGNYTADDDTHPREVTFANGRRVRVVGDGYLAVNTLDSQGSEEATRG